MLVFIDESGDSGLKIDEGSSRYFTISLVVFNDNDEAAACDQRIQLLKHELNWPANSEFHFKRNSHDVKKAFLTAIAPYDFFYYGLVINKDPKKLWGPGFQDKSSFYKYTCGLVFENAKNMLSAATVIIDESGDLDFRRQLSKYLRKKMNSDGKTVIHKVKMEDSNSNNLLQVADYIAGIISRSMKENKKHSTEYRKIVAHREINVQVWPK